ncbi:uncharacterized protein [Littorina saxatilis]
MGWKQNKMAAKGESTNNDSTPSTYSPLTRKPSGHHSAHYSVPHVAASCYTKSTSKTQYDALPVGTLGTYDPAADEIDYSFYQNARPNRRRLLYSRAPDPDPEDERLGDSIVSTNGGGGGRRKNRGRKDSAVRSRSNSELADPAEDNLIDEAELSTETLYVMLLVLASTAVTMLAAYLILL